MSKTVLLLTSMTLAMFLTFGAAPEPRFAQAQSGPNILVILTDDMKRTDLRYMPKTQSLLASRGMVFSRAYVTMPQCCPSRATILTGLYPHNHGVWGSYGEIGGADRFRDLGLESKTIAASLQAAGYRTGLFGKYLNEYDGTWVPEGWDEWFARTQEFTGNDFNDNGEMVHFDDAIAPDEITAERALAFVGDPPGEKPFFAYIATHAPHAPYIIPERHRDAFENLRLDEREPFNEADVSDKPEWVKNKAQFGQKAITLFNERHRDRLRSLLTVDEMVGSLVERLEGIDELDETYIIFTSDNGYIEGEHRLYGKLAAYEPSIRIPLLITGPGVSEGSTDALAVNNDLAPTLAELAAVSIEADGRSLAPLFDGQAPVDWRKRFLVEYQQTEFPDGSPLPVPTYDALRSRGELYVEYAGGERERYEFKVDPLQLENVYYETTPARKEALATQLEALKGCARQTCEVAEN